MPACLLARANGDDETETEQLVNTAACVRHDNTRDFDMSYNADDRVHHFSVPIYMFHFGCFAR